MDVPSTSKEMTPLFLLPLGDNLENTQAMNKLSTFVSTYDPASAIIVYSAFASEHLPQYLEVATKSLRALIPSGDLIVVLSGISATNAFGRWVRENRGNGRARALLGEFIAWISSTVCVVVLHSLLVQLPPSFSHSNWIELFALTEYANAARRFSDVIRPYLAHARSNPKDDGFATAVDLVDDFLSGGQSLSKLKAITLKIVSMPWLHCEGRRRFGKGNCVKVKEMMACGKCKAVRYCSKAHQKADWKDHKQVCFDMKWAKDDLDG